MEERIEKILCELVIEYACRPGVPISGFETGCLAPQPADLMERAVDCASLADAAVVVVGLDAEWETEGRDREDLELPGRQSELVERVALANPATVVVLNAGSPVRMEWLEHVQAVLQLWYPGQECGNALADVLFGDADPSGRLPITFPRQREDDPTRVAEPGEFELRVGRSSRDIRARATFRLLPAP